MKHNLTKASSVIVAITLFGSLITGANASVIINIEANDSDTNATVTWSGSLILFDAQDTYIGGLAHLPGSGGSGSWAPLGNNPFDFSNAAHNWANVQDNNTVLFGHVGMLNMSITDASNGGSLIDDYSYVEFQYTGNSFGDDPYIFNYGSDTYSSDVDAGDIAIFSGSLEFNLVGTFGNDFNKGAYTIQYNNQDVSIVIQNPSTIPEPSSALLLGIGSLGFTLRRHRSTNQK